MTMGKGKTGHNFGGVAETESARGCGSARPKLT
jgi:hypothetical protein